VLLDADQPTPTKVDRWRMKYRFYFDEYKTQLNGFCVWSSTKAYNNEYDVPKSKADCLDPKTPKEACTHVIRCATGRAPRALPACIYIYICIVARAQLSEHSCQSTYVRATLSCVTLSF
jgi:hypothetical protein